MADTKIPMSSSLDLEERNGKGGGGGGGTKGLVGVRAEAFIYASHVLGIAVAVLVLVWCIHFRGGLAFESSNKSRIFNIHPVLMLIGFIILGSEAIMSFRALPGSKEVKKLIHLALHTFALILGAVGISAAFKFHNESGIDNLYSLHSWIGLTTICLYGIQWIFGFITFFYPGGAPGVKRIALPWHVLCGIFAYILAIATAELGFLEKMTFLESFGGLYRYSTEALLVNFTALLVICLGASVVISTIAPYHAEDSDSYKSVPEDK